MKTIITVFAIVSLSLFQGAMAHETLDGYHKHTVEHLQQHMVFLRSTGQLSQHEQHQIGSDLIDAIQYLKAGSQELARQYLEFIFEQERFHLHRWQTVAEL